MAVMSVRCRGPYLMRKLAFMVVGLAIAGFAAFWLVTIPVTVPASALAAHTPNLANGQSMFYAGGCAACHATPEQEDRTRLGGGLALKTPFGTFYAPNISPDPNDGIGRWSEADFVTALWKGTSPSGQHYYPVFPYGSYQHMALADVRDLFAYLRTLAPVAGPSRAHEVTFPLGIRRLVGGWKFLFLDGAPFRPDPNQSEQWNRGAYLVNGPGHCAECHSPRNLLGAVIASRRFTGGQSVTGQGGVPNITQGKLRDWKVEDFVETLDTGMTPDSDKVGGAMVAVVSNTSQLSAADREAMAV